MSASYIAMGAKNVWAFDDYRMDCDDVFRKSNLNNGSCKSQIYLLNHVFG